jgi:perosamine synthetase
VVTPKSNHAKSILGTKAGGWNIIVILHFFFAAAEPLTIGRPSFTMKSIRDSQGICTQVGEPLFQRRPLMTQRTQPQVTEVPFFRPSITDAEIDEVVACLRTGWLTTGPRNREFEARFAEAVGAQYSVGVNSCTAALHLAVESLGLRADQAVLVPTMTFAATAEVVRYQGAIPLLVDCDPVTLDMDLDDAERKIADLRAGRTPLDPGLAVVGIMPVHVGGLMMDVAATKAFAARHRLWTVEDAAHSFPAALRVTDDAPWQRCGEDTADVTCFSFYANKTITTGEGGMAVTNNCDLADRMRQMSLHGLSHDAWDRYAGKSNSWDYKIVAPGYKYNLTDVAAAIGIHQLARAEVMRCQREEVARIYDQRLSDVAEIELPPWPGNRIHSWHLYPIRLRLDSLSIDRNEFIRLLRERGVGCSVHWRPLHLHPYYCETFGWEPQHLPVATAQWERLVSLPLFPDMRAEEQEHVIGVVRDLCRQFGTPTPHRKATQADALRPEPLPHATPRS